MTLTGNFTNLGLGPLGVGLGQVSFDSSNLPGGLGEPSLAPERGEVGSDQFLYNRVVIVSHKDTVNRLCKNSQ